MSLIPTYAPPDNLPAPLTYGGIQSYTDIYGDVWVALVGVNGGAWRRAKDVLFSHVYRVAALNLTAGGATTLMDGTISDNYSLYNPGFQSGVGAYIIPVAGWYEAVHQVGGTATAVGQQMDARIYNNGVLMSVARVHTTLATSFSAITTYLGLCNVNDYVQPWDYCSATIAAIVGSGTPPSFGPGYWTYSILRYRGTG